MSPPPNLWPVRGARVTRPRGRRGALARARVDETLFPSRRRVRVNPASVADRRARA